MIKKSIFFLLILMLCTAFFFGIQYFIVEVIKRNNSLFFYKTSSIYIFHFFATFFIFLFVAYVHKTFPEKVGFVFMACSLLKMIATIVFLLPLIQSEQKSVLNDIIAFFIPYFLYLFLETFYTLKIINKA